MLHHVGDDPFNPSALRRSRLIPGFPAETLAECQGMMASTVLPSVQRIFEATGSDITDLGEEHGHRVLRVCGKGTKVVLIPLPPAVGRTINQAIGDRTRGPILLNSRGARMDRHAATRRLRRLAETAGVRISRPHPHMLRHTFVTTMLDAGVDLRDVQIAARHADPRTTMRYDRGPQEPRPPARIISWPPTWPPAPDQGWSPKPKPGRHPALPMSDCSTYGRLPWRSLIE